MLKIGTLRGDVRMARLSKIMIGLTLAICTGGCAASNTSATSSLAPASGPVGQPMLSKATYQLSADEQALACKQLTGRMQIRILEIRDYNERNRTTLLARALQSGTTSVVGGSSTGTDPDGTYAKDRAVLEAYNAQLAAKGCKTYDLESELQPQDVRVTPTASIKPVAKSGN